MKKIRYAMIGCGNFGKSHLKELTRMEEVEVIALCDTHIEAAEEKKAFFKLNANCYADYRQLLEKETPDVVAVVTSDQTHREITVAALRAGCHVMCEKPMALKLAECEEMVQTAKECGRLLMIGQICRYTPGFAKAKELVEKGVIGELTFIESEYAHDYSAPQYKGADGWRATKGREPIIGGACHAIDLLRWIAGDPIETFAYSNKKMLPDWPVDDATIAIFKFPREVIGKVFTSISCKRDYTMRTCIYGTKGTIIVNNTDPYLTLYLEKIEGAPFAGGQIAGVNEEAVCHQIKVSINNHNVAEEHQQMVSALLNGTPLLTPGEEGARTVAVCTAVVEAAKSGAPVKIHYPV